MTADFRDLHWARDISLKEYLVPKSLGEALDMLAHYEGKARVTAGGTDIIPQLRHRDMEVDALVDVTGLPDMGGIEEEGDEIVLGGLVTHAQVASSPLVRKRAGLLGKGAGSVGSPQIRNVATVAGNLVSGQPAADTSIPLLALNASVAIVSKEGERTVPLTEFFVDTGKTVLDCSKEILTKIRFKALQENQGACYLRLSKRKALTLPMLVFSTVVEVDPGRELIRSASIALGPVAPVPFRVRECENGLCDAPITTETLRAAADIGMRTCNPRDSRLRGSCEYRQEMIHVLVRRGLKKAIDQAGAMTSVGWGG